MELKYDPRETISQLYNTLEEVINERNAAEWECGRLKEELKEQSEKYRFYWSSSQTTITELRKELFDMRRELDLAELRLKVMQLEERNAMLRESLDEVR